MRHFHDTIRLLAIVGLAVAGFAVEADQAAAQGRSVRPSNRLATNVSRDRSTLYPEQTVRLYVSNTDNVIPPLVKGDREFDGNGPSVWVFVHYYVQGDSVYRRIRMRATEDHDLGKYVTGKDATEADGWSTPKRIYKAPAGSRVVGVLGDFADGPRQILFKEMSGHSSFVQQTLAGRVTVWGDRKGKDVGGYTRTAINFAHTLPVLISTRATNRVTVELPRTLTIKPPLVSGDAEFAGHGPHIRVQASVINAGGSRLLFTMYMTAWETYGFNTDRTVAKGGKVVEMYRPPAGYRIAKVYGQVSFPMLIDSVDSDHKVEKLRTELGPAHVFGDRKGKDAGVYTRVVFPNIERAVIVDLEPIP